MELVECRILVEAVGFLVPVGMANIAPKEPNCYELLGLAMWPARSAGPTDIAKVYRAQAGRVQPDVNKDKQHSHVLFVELQVAYETVASVSGRRVYDLHAPQQFARTCKARLQQELLKLAIGVFVRLAVAWTFTSSQETARYPNNPEAPTSA